MEPTHMQAALHEAASALEAGDFPVGAALVHEGQVIGRGRNRVTSGDDLTLHAEMDVLRQAASYLREHEGQCELYTTLEPCMMCAGAIAFAGIKRVVYAAPDPARGVAELFEQREFYRSKKVSFELGNGDEESQRLLESYEQQK